MVLQSSGAISFSQIRNEFGGPTSVGPISLSQYKVGGTYGGQVASNPNNIPNSNSLISLSKFYSAAKWTYDGSYSAVNQLGVAGGWGITNQDANSKLIWIDPLQYTAGPIANYPINFYYIFQNATGADISGSIYVFQDDNGTYYLNGSTIGNYTYSGSTNTINTTFKVGQNLFRGTLTNGGVGAGGFQLTFKDGSGGTIMYTDSNWKADAQCLLHYNNWHTSFTAYNRAGTALSKSGSDPDVQYRLGFSTGSTANYLYLSSATTILNYSSFTLYFEINVTTGSGADGLFAFFGSNSLNIIEGGGYNSFTLGFQIYTGGGKARGIYLHNGAGTQVGFYATSGFIASAWQPVYVYYTKGTTNTWKINWNGTDVITYSDPNNASFITNAGSYAGFGFRDGGVSGSAYVRHVQVYNKA